jgi:hypothetical protein
MKNKKTLKDLANINTEYLLTGQYILIFLKMMAGKEEM